MSPPAGFLQVEGENIVLNGKPIVLKGAAVGGWMTMENFINGYPGHEFQFRAAMKEVLGEAKSEFFFDKFLTYWFTEDDVKLFAKLGFNCIRLPVNYRHFEDDMNPRVIDERGYKHLDRVIDMCAKYGIYSIIDLHCAPGGQSGGWHCDSGLSAATFWTQKDHQDRAINLWEHWARRYKDNPWVAGYNPLNEPADEKRTRVLDWYDSVEKAIRAIDPYHILFLDGNTFGSDFRGFEERPPLPNSVYACHDYSAYGFPAPPELFTGTPEQIQYHEKAFERKTDFMRQIKGPIWNGEWGPGRRSSAEEADQWGVDDREVKDLFAPVVKWLQDTVPSYNSRYPGIWKPERHVSRLIREMLLSEELVKEFAELFRGKSEEELDELAKSFLLSNCTQRDRLCDILGTDARQTKGA